MMKREDCVLCMLHQIMNGKRVDIGLHDAI